MWFLPPTPKSVFIPPGLSPNLKFGDCHSCQLLDREALFQDDNNVDAIIQLYFEIVSEIPTPTVNDTFMLN